MYYIMLHKIMYIFMRSLVPRPHPKTRRGLGEAMRANTLCTQYAVRRGEL